MILRLTLLISTLCCYLTAEACSSAIITAERSKEGCVMLWKHRDQTKWADTRVAHFDDGKYAYTALVNSYYKQNYSVYGGINSAGFGIMSTSTSNLKRDYEVETPPEYEYSLSTEALRECATVDEFEELLKRRRRSSGSQSNIGVGDRFGGAAYFEIWSDGYKRYDVKDRKEGYDIRTNFSFAGDYNRRGASERRYRTVDAQMRGVKSFAAADFIGYSRSFFSADKGCNILSDNQTYKDANYTVPRASSVGSMVIVCGAEPRIDIIVGHPVAGFAVPVWVDAKHSIPQCVAGRAMFELGQRFVRAAYTKSGKSKILNKDIARKALSVKTQIKTPKRMPKDIDAFNAAVDRTFEKHRNRLVQVLRLE